MIEVKELQKNIDFCTISCTNNKSKKLKKKNTAVECLPTYYENVLRQYPVSLRNSKAKGRHAVASENLEGGTLLCKEQASAFVVRAEFLDQQCHICLTDLSTKMMCADCKKTFYCSKECMETDEEIHKLACSVFSQVDAIGKATDVDPDLLRLITLLMIRRYFDKSVNETSSDSTNNPTPYTCVEDLLSHKESANPAFIRVLTDASQRLLMEMPESIQLPVEEMVTLACRINSNAHGLGDNQSRNTDVALGLFPLGAMFFNHGCNPNTAFIGLANGQLAFRTIREVKKDEELVVSYIDLYSDRDERRQELLTSKHFWCKCKRCIGPLDKSIDRFLQGVVCSKCGNDVYVIPATMMDDLIKGHRALYTESKSFKCAACNDERDVDDTQAILAEANKLYEFGMAAIRQERNYRRASEKLELITKSATTKNGLHTLNSFRLNAYIPLMNCMRYNNNLKGAIETNKAILSLMSEYSKLGLPGNTAEISDYWQNLGELCDKMASESRGRSSILEKKWSKESRHAFGEALKIRIVVFGKDHPKTKHVEKFA